MSADIGKGDWVECINNSLCIGGGKPNHQAKNLVVGAIYQVRDANIHPYGFPAITLVGGLRYKETYAGRRFCGFALGRFRLIYRPKADLISSLLRKVKEPSLEGVG